MLGWPPPSLESKPSHWVSSTCVAAAAPGALHVPPGTRGPHFTSAFHTDVSGAKGDSEPQRMGILGNVVPADCWGHSAQPPGVGGLLFAPSDSGGERGGSGHAQSHRCSGGLGLQRR